MYQPWHAHSQPFSDPLRPAGREVVKHGKQLVREYERVRNAPRSDAYRAAYDALAEHVRMRGGWIQVDGLRFVWSKADGLIRTPVESVFQRRRPPVKV